jgi:hypothetical protein
MDGNRHPCSKRKQKDEKQMTDIRIDAPTKVGCASTDCDVVLLLKNDLALRFFANAKGRAAYGKVFTALTLQSPPWADTNCAPDWKAVSFMPPVEVTSENIADIADDFVLAGVRIALTWEGGGVAADIIAEIEHELEPERDKPQGWLQ